MSIVEELERLNDLKQSGAISDKEYDEAKASLLAEGRAAGPKEKQPTKDGELDINNWGMLIHLSQFAGYVVPLAGLVLPIVLWQIKKGESEVIDRHGRIVLNWIITECIFGVVFGLLCFVMIGLPLLLALAVVAIVFPIIGAVKASGGEVWQYPCSIRFLRAD